MRNMELCTKLMSHTVCNSKARCIEGKTCQAGCYMTIRSTWILLQEFRIRVLLMR